MKTVTMSKECFDFLRAAKAIRPSGINYTMNGYIVVVDAKRKGFGFVLSDQAA